MNSLFKTPLQIALENKDSINYCDECPSSVLVKGTLYCGVSGKIILPMFLERGNCYGTARNCEDKPKKGEIG